MVTPIDVYWEVCNEYAYKASQDHYPDEAKREDFTVRYDGTVIGVVKGPLDLTALLVVACTDGKVREIESHKVTITHKPNV